MGRHGVRALLCAVLLLCALRSAVPANTAAIVHVEHGPNAPAQQNKHYVVLLSLDGFRYDYAKKYGAPRLDAMAEHGAWSPDGMIPAYPSVALPNHYTLVTGLYPEHHGIVAMTFYDPALAKRYAFNDAAAASDGSWYRGVPLWSLAERQGMRTACISWPGSQAEIAGERPSDYLRFGAHLEDEAALDQVAAWLRLPDTQRPHFIALHYAHVERAGRAFGPEAPETRDAVHAVDTLVGKLEGKLEKLHLPIDLIVVSDAGMAAEQDDWITLDTYADLSQVESAGSLLYAKNDAAADAVYQKLKIVDGRFTVYRRARMPAALEYKSDPRIGDPVVVPNGPYAIRAHAPEPPSHAPPPDRGVRGYDPSTVRQMRAIFYAEGPDIRSGVRLRAFENVNLYPFIAEILGLDAPSTDGSAGVLSSALTAAPAP
jgi:predicted AlkP superfamily pyrophosphatase or phosphodiesterase